MSYNQSLSTKEFLEIIYIKINRKIIKLIELIDNKKSYKDLILISEEKSKLSEIFEILSTQTNSIKLKNLYLYFITLLYSKNNNDLKILNNYIISFQK